MRKGKANPSCSDVSLGEPSTRTHTWLLSPGLCARRARRLLPHIPRGSPHPSPPWSTARDTEPWAAKPRQWGQADTWATLAPQDSGVPGASGVPARKMASKRGQDPNRLREAAPMAVTKSKQISKKCCSWWWSHWCIQSATTPTIYLKGVLFIVCKLPQQSWYKNYLKNKKTKKPKNNSTEKDFFVR